MKIKRKHIICLIFIFLLICIANVAYANMTYEAIQRSNWFARRQPNVINLSLIAMVVTVFVELIIAKLMKMGNYKTIIVTNILTQMFLHISMINLFTCVIPIIIILFLEFIIWFTEFLIYVTLFSEKNEKKIFTYVMLANVITFVAPYVILYNSYTLPNDYNGYSVIPYDIIYYISYILFVLYIVSLAITISTREELKTAKEHYSKERIDETAYTSLKKRLLLLEIAAILLGITSFNTVIFDEGLMYWDYGMLALSIGSLAPIVCLILIIKILIRRFKTKSWY